MSRQQLTLVERTHNKTDAIIIADFCTPSNFIEAKSTARNVHSFETISNKLATIFDYFIGNSYYRQILTPKDESLYI